MEVKQTIFKQAQAGDEAIIEQVVTNMILKNIGQEPSQKSPWNLEHDKGETECANEKKRRSVRLMRKTTPRLMARSVRLMRQSTPRLIERSVRLMRKCRPRLMERSVRLMRK